MSYIQTLSKKQNAESRPILSTKIGVFVDSSGSTSSKLRGQNILAHEMMLARLYDVSDTTICTWSSFANVYKNDSLCYPDGCTEPNCILLHPHTRSIFEEADTVVFMTDGEIDPTSVTCFAANVREIVKNKTIICILVCEKKTNPNVSVFAPFLIANDVIMLHFYGEQFLDVLFAKGQFAAYSVGTQMMPDKLKKMNIFLNMPEIPSGYVVIGEDEKTIKLYHPQNLLSAASFDRSSISLAEWKTVLQHAKINNVLGRFRAQIDKWRNADMQTAISMTQQNVSRTHAQKKQDIIAAILRSQNDAEKLELSHQLKELLPLAREEELENMKLVNNSVGAVKKYWEEIRAMLFHYEAASYSLNDIAYASNRALRAKDIDEAETVNSMIDNRNVPLMYCALHLDEGPAVLWLQSPEDISQTTSDFVINFPLAKHSALQKCIKSNPVCGDCASEYFAVTKDTLFREHIDGFVPLNVRNNQQYIFATLCKILCNSKSLGHVNMLLLSMVDDCAYGWLDKAVKDYVVKELVTNVVTTDTFNEDGIKMPIIRALSRLNKTTLFRQPFYSGIRLLTFSKQYASCPNETVLELAREQFTYALLMGVLSSLLKRGYEYNVSAINGLLYDTVCGIPMYNSAHFPSVNDIEKFVSRDELADMLEILARLAATMNCTVDSVICPEMVGQLLCALKQIRMHARPTVAYESLMKTSSLFKRAITTDKTTACTNIKHDLAGRYKKKSDNTFVPPYAFYNGEYSAPSKLFFKDQSLVERLAGTTQSIDDLVNHLNREFSAAMSKEYGSVYPNETSAHAPVHRIVAHECEQNFPHADTPSVEVIAKCMEAVKNTCGKKGNIYDYQTVTCVILCVYDFMEIKKTHNYYETTDSMKVSFKVRSELLARGISVDGCDRVTIPNLEKPTDLWVKYKDIDFEPLVKQIDDYMKTHTTQQQTENVAEMLIQMPFIIDVPENQQKLESWEKEQLEIANLATLKDAFELASVKKIGGMDISFDKNNASNAVASLVVFEYPFALSDPKPFKILGRFSIKCTTNIPYRAGYLAFRECPILLKLIEIIKQDYPDMLPDVIITDSNGVWHQRGCGLATHFAVLSGIPTFGVAKTVLRVNNITEDYVLNLLKEQAPNEGDYVHVIDETGRELGYAFNPTGAVHSSLCVSAGHLISNKTAMEIVKTVSIHRVIEPIRQADLLSRSLL